MLLETYSSLDGEKLLNCLPKFLNIVKEVTGDPSFSMFNLSLKEDWSKTKKFCHSLHGKDQRNQISQQTNNHCDDETQTNGIAQAIIKNSDRTHYEHNNHENRVNNEYHESNNANSDIATSPN